MAVAHKRMVIDSNQLQSERLRMYLSHSRSNFAVLTDYAAMEAYKGDTLKSIYTSMAILCEYPGQVVVLKSTKVVCGLSGRGSGLQRRLIDRAQTTEFAAYASALVEARRGNANYEGQLLAHGREASIHIEQMLKDAESMGSAIEGIAAMHSKVERAAFRSRVFPRELIDKSIKNILSISAYLFGRHPQVVRAPNYKDLPNTFIFRASLCMYLLALDWAANGGAGGASAAKLRNDTIDMNFAAYATFFDGILSADKKTIRLYREARVWLSALFGR